MEPGFSSGASEGGRRTAPGYAPATELPAADAAAPLFYFLLLLAVTLPAIVYELALRQPRAYLVAAPSVPAAVSLVAAGAGALAGGLLARRARPAALPWLLLALAAIAGGSAPAWFWCFGHRASLLPVALGVPLLGGAAAAAVAVAAARATATIRRRIALWPRLLNPFRLAGTIAAASLAAFVASVVGLLRSAAALAAVACLLAAWAPRIGHYFEIPAPGGRRAQALGLLGVCLAALGLWRFEAWVPSEELSSFPNDVVWAHTTDRGRYVVTSGQQSLELFVDGRLKLSSNDAHRYYEALVHPAMSRAERHARVLAIGGGHGLLEAELLRYPDLGQLTLLVVDADVVALSANAVWPGSAAGRLLASPRVRLVEAEPIAWLARSAERFDVIVVDLPDPSDHVEGKNYTSFFYRALRARLAPGGVAVVQATSAFSSPGCFRSIRSMLDAAGFYTLAYHAPVPSYGDWGFVLAALEPPPPPGPLPSGLAFLTPSVHAALFELPRDTVAPAAPPSTLHDQRLVELFERETSRSAGVELAEE